MEVEETRAAFVSVVEAEERVKLMKTMIANQVGFPEVEYYFKKQSQHCRVEDKKTKRNVQQIEDSMRFKLRDAVADLKKLKRLKIRAKKRFNNDSSVKYYISSVIFSSFNRYEFSIMR